MKLIRTTVEQFEVDVNAERNRLVQCFTGRQLKRQLAIFNAFLDGDIATMKALYDKLPRCSQRECSEAEYVGTWMAIFSGSDWGLQPVKRNVTVQFDPPEKSSKKG